MNLKIVIPILILLSLVSCSIFQPSEKGSGISVTATHSNNFSFIYQGTSCGPKPVYVLDTKKGLLTYTPLGGKESITIPLQLSEDEMEAIYEKAISIGFFSFPSIYVIPSQYIRFYNREPASRYQLSMINGEKTNSVSWTDDTITISNYVDPLKDLIILIANSFIYRPEVKQLPKGTMYCA